MRRTPRISRPRDPRTRPQVVAHRGSSHETPEHTLTAYVKALDEGAEALECDVRLTADGHLVCVHDRDLRRTASTAGIVSTMNLAELDELDFASWKSPWSEMDDEAPERDPQDGKVLTLRKLLETVADYDRHVELAIETKHPTRYGGLVERRLVETLGDFGWDRAGSPARVMSFSLNAVNRVRKLAPDLDVVMLVEKAHHWPMLRPVVGDDWIIGPGIKELRDHPGLGRHLVKEGREIHVWTVNTAEDLKICLDLGVTAVISDRPGYMLELLGG
jgi:glycerophosphoryl diester phosphodiesterase